MEGTWPLCLLTEAGVPTATAPAAAASLAATPPSVAAVPVTVHSTAAVSTTATVLWHPVAWTSPTTADGRHRGHSGQEIMGHYLQALAGLP